MKLMKKWLFPALTCLLVTGAALLPPHLSQVRDQRQLGQLHVEELDADGLPAAPASTLADRMALYADRVPTYHPVLRFSDPVYFEDSESQALAQAVQDQLVEAGVLPRWIFEEDPFGGTNASRVLLWDPETADIFREPSVFWEISWEYSGDKSHSKSMRVTQDAETGRLIRLWIHDTNMSQWMPYDKDHLRRLAERFFALLDLDIRETDLGHEPLAVSLELRYAVAGTGLSFYVSRDPTVLTIQPDFNWRNQGNTGSNSSGYDG